jgi:hypothetical protein
VIRGKGQGYKQESDGFLSQEDLLVILTKAFPYMATPFVGLLSYENHWYYSFAPHPSLERVGRTEI